MNLLIAYVKQHLKSNIIRHKPTYMDNDEGIDLQVKLGNSTLYYRSSETTGDLVLIHTHKCCMIDDVIKDEILISEMVSLAYAYSSSWRH